MKSWILSVGDEVLSGNVINSNYATIASYFNLIGIDVVKGINVGDNRIDIKNTVLEFFNSDNDILITTGGLGPTHDDFTKEVISESLGIPLEYNEQASLDLYNYFREKKKDCNLKQVFYPKNCIILPNKVGSADGFVIEYHNKYIIALVGVPFEMEYLLKNEVIPFLKAKGKTKLYKSYIIMGECESALENRLIPFLEKHKNVSICPYCAPGKIRYQLTAEQQYQNDFIIADNDFKELMGNYIVSDKDEEIENIIYNDLKKYNFHISCAESCTGGLLASTIINVNGASDIISESYITYSNEAKINLLNVKKETIDKYDVVSLEVVKEMVLGLYNITKSEVCLAVSGYAGPTGENVGKVCYAIKVNDSIHCFMDNYHGSRNFIRLMTVRRILYHLHCILNEL